MSRLGTRVDALEARTGETWFTFTTTAGRTVRASVDDVLGVFLGGPLPAALADVASTRETAQLARDVVRLAVEAREPGRDGG
jgi:hypothetical protein